jgi:hypothetical protein
VGKEEKWRRQEEKRISQEESNGTCKRPASDRWSPASQLPMVGDWSVPANQLPTAGCRLGVQQLGEAGDQRSSASRVCLSYCRVTVFYFFIFLFFYFFIFLFFYFFLNKKSLGVLRNFLTFWEYGCTVHPFFQASPYTWKYQIFHSS